MKHLFTLFIILMATQMSFAQSSTLIDNTGIIEEEKFVHIYKDSRLDILDKRPAIIAKAELEAKNTKTIASNTPVERVTPLYKPIVSADGKKKVTGSISTAKGFRVIIYNGPDREKAMLAKNNFGRAFPGTRSYMSYNVPSYKIKVGDFESRKDASNFLRRVNSSFPASFIVPDIVTVKNINVSN